MSAPALAMGLAASAATLAGGLLALRHRGRVVLLLGLTAGVVLGVALLDLAPEAMELGAGRWSPRALAGWMAAGLGFYMLLDRGLAQAARVPARWRAHLGPATLTAHSFADGLGIGLAFQVDAGAGWLVALAVLLHDMADGANTVGLCLAARAEGSARAWVLLNGAAPLLGVVAGTALPMASAALPPLLATFAGLFLYMGACELAPRSLLVDPRLRTTAASLAGMALVYAATLVAG